MIVPSPDILLYYSLLSPKGEGVKAEKRKTADARTREKRAHLPLIFSMRVEKGGAQKKWALPREGVPAVVWRETSA